MAICLAPPGLSPRPPTTATIDPLANLLSSSGLSSTSAPCAPVDPSQSSDGAPNSNASPGGGGGAGGGAGGGGLSPPTPAGTTATTNSTAASTLSPDNSNQANAVGAAGNVSRSSEGVLVSTGIVGSTKSPPALGPVPGPSQHGLQQQTVQTNAAATPGAPATSSGVSGVSSGTSINITAPAANNTGSGSGTNNNNSSSGTSGNVSASAGVGSVIDPSDFGSAAQLLFPPGSSLDMDDGGKCLLDVINDPLLFQSFFEGREDADGDGLSANMLDQHLESLAHSTSVTTTTNALGGNPLVDVGGNANAGGGGVVVGMGGNLGTVGPNSAGVSLALGSAIAAGGITAAAALRPVSLANGGLSCPSQSSAQSTGSPDGAANVHSISKQERHEQQQQQQQQQQRQQQQQQQQQFQMTHLENGL